MGSWCVTMTLQNIGANLTAIMNVISLCRAQFIGTNRLGKVSHTAQMSRFWSKETDILCPWADLAAPLFFWDSCMIMIGLCKGTKSAGK